jgi:hypothetical protein
LKTGQKLRTAARKWKIVLPTAAVLVSIGWLSFRAKTPVSNSSNTLAQPLPAVVVSIPADEPPMAVAKPEPGVRAGHAKAGLPRGVVMASTSETMRSESALESKPQARAAVEDADGAMPNPNLRSPAVGNLVEEVATAPPLGAASPQGDAMLAEVLSPSSALPARPSLRTSQGVSGGRIERRVDPIYPPQALRARIEGHVVVQALVTARREGNRWKLVI